MQLCYKILYYALQNPALIKQTTVRNACLEGIWMNILQMIISYQWLLYTTSGPDSILHFNEQKTVYL
ncbi:hypothetical protein OIU74_022035 [Salix koriyanagi]|uniref:Uncharacterized protein n=1 Tax=Salix koriyanagi TaxID=2511006 RepID=A0A9Q0WKX9_9ROSI|nr:hypothetical protein OIU74_022035 [Salix koriyanagi]